MCSIHRVSIYGLMALFLAGCAQSHRFSPRDPVLTLRQRAMAALKAGIRYQHNPAVRVASIEALESSGPIEARAWIRSALVDEHAAVRFAACVAVGRLGDQGALQQVRDRAGDKDASVRVAALFALHRLGYTKRTGEMATYLLRHGDAAVRRNAALLLGLLNEPGAVKVLAGAMRDGDAGVRQHALEAMARLGNREAKQELTFMANAGVGSEEVFAIAALAGTGDRAYFDTFRYKLSTAAHRETRLAAARGLGLLGSDLGFDVVLKALETDSDVREDPNDPAAAQVLRVRLLAVTALGAIGRREGLTVCSRLMAEPGDPRIQVAAAKAVLEILEEQRRWVLPASARAADARRGT